MGAEQCSWQGTQLESRRAEWAGPSQRQGNREGQHVSGQESGFYSEGTGEL